MNYARLALLTLPAIALLPSQPRSLSQISDRPYPFTWDRTFSTMAAIGHQLKRYAIALPDRRPHLMAMD